MTADKVKSVDSIRVIVCKPGEAAVAAENEDDLDVMRELVGGHLEEYMPFHSDTDPRRK